MEQPIMGKIEQLTNDPWRPAETINDDMRKEIRKIVREEVALILWRDLENRCPELVQALKKQLSQFNTRFPNGKSGTSVLPSKVR